MRNDALSSTEGKRDESLALVAHHFVKTKVSAGEEITIACPINKLLVCSNAHTDWPLFTPALARGASVYPLQIPSDMAASLSVPHMPFFMKSVNVI